MSFGSGGIPDVSYDDGGVRYVDCPLCGSPDTRAEPEKNLDGGRGWILRCTNLECTSNQWDVAKLVEEAHASGRA